MGPSHFENIDADGRVGAGARELWMVCTNGTLAFASGELPGVIPGVPGVAPAMQTLNSVKAL